MPRGPFGFPRVTDIGPFVDVETSQRFVREDKGTKKHFFADDEEIIKVFGVDEDTIVPIRARLEVNKEEGNTSDGTILGNIRSEINDLQFPKEVAHMRYWYSLGSGVAKVEGVTTDEDFTRMGIAKTLRQKEINYMRDLGVGILLTDIVSEGGYNLAKSTGARPIDELNTEAGLLEFDHEVNRGIMFNRL